MSETAEENSVGAVERRRVWLFLLHVDSLVVVGADVAVAPGQMDGTKPAAARDRSLADLEDTPLPYDTDLIAVVVDAAVVGDAAVARAAADRTPASRSPLLMISQDPAVDDVGITSLALFLVVQLNVKQDISTRVEASSRKAGRYAAK